MIRKLLSIIAVIALLTGCSADEPFGPGAVTGDTALQLLVPDTRMSLATRAESGEPFTRDDQTYDLAADEAKITTLYLVAFSGNAGARKHYFADLGKTSPTKVNSIYAAYTLYLNPDDYDLYLFANINPGTDLLGRLKGNTTDADLEKDVKAMLAKTKSDGSVGSAVPGFLPMSYATSSSVTVEKGKTKQVTAKLDFAVAKVRFTMLYGKAFGSNYYLDMAAGNPITVKNYYKTSKAFPTSSDKGEDAADVVNAYVSSKFCNWPVITGEVFATDEALLKYLEEWRDNYTSTSGNMNTADPLGRLGSITSFNAAAAAAANYRYAHQTITYLPESLDKSEEQATTLVVNATKCKVEDSGATPEDNPFTVIAGVNNGSNYSLQRGHFYDIIGYVTPAGDITYHLLEDIKWDPEPLNVSLAGTVYLDLGTTLIPSVSGAAPYYMSYNTNSPAIRFESDTYEETGIPYFLISPDPNQEDVLEVSINPVCPETSPAVTGKGFWVQTGNLRKRVNITTADFSEFLTISPSTRTLNVAQIINEEEYPVYFTWSTNKKDLKLSVENLTAAIANDENSRSNLTITFQKKNDEGEWKDILSKQRIENKRYGSTITLPSNGRIVVNVIDPTNPKYFSSEITMDIKAEATSQSGSQVSTKKANLRIVPTPTKYRVYFKDENWSQTWTNPHIYAYQPLEVYDPLTGRDVAVMDENRMQDWIEYSFTGNLTFKGWIPYGGTVDPTTSGISSTNDWSLDNYLNSYYDKNGYDQAKYCFGVWKEGAGGPNDYKNENVVGYYYTDIDLMPKWRQRYDTDETTGETIGEMVCTKCRDTSNTDNINTLWPGVAMKKSMKHLGWWYVDLPLLAKPGKTYLMFIDVTSGDHAAAVQPGDDLSKLRFPYDDVPGVILPNYPDKEAWYLCNKDNITTTGKGNQKWTNEFTDDKPE